MRSWYTGECRCFFNLFRLQVVFAQGQCDGEDRAPLAVGAVFGFDGAVVHVDNHLAKVQADTRAVNMQSPRVGALVESFEDVLKSFIVQTDARVADGQFHLLFICGDLYVDASAFKAVFESVGEQVGDDFLKLRAVEPYVEFLKFFVFEVEVDAALLCVIFKHLADTLGETDDVGQLAVQLHLLLVDLADVKNLVHEVQNALGIVVDGLGGRSSVQFLQCGEDERQRRAYIVGGVDEELHFLLVHFLVSVSAVGIEHVSQQRGRQ